MSISRKRLLVSCEAISDRSVRLFVSDNAVSDHGVGLLMHCKVTGDQGRCLLVGCGGMGDRSVCWLVSDNAVDKLKAQQDFKGLRISARAEVSYGGGGAGLSCYQL